MDEHHGPTSRTPLPSAATCRYCLALSAHATPSDLRSHHCRHHQAITDAPGRELGVSRYHEVATENYREVPNW
jgi:hypothetical protein